MNLYKIERKLGKFAIPNLMLGIVVLMFAVYVGEILFPQLNIVDMLSLDSSLVLQGQVWRLVTFLIIPPGSSIFFILFSLYFYYLIGNTLENQWGAFKFNVYYLIGTIGIIIASFIIGYGTNVYLNYSLFFAFAVLYPDFELLLFFFIPIKIKYLAIIDAVFFAISFILGDLTVKISIIVSLINFLIFFGPDFIKKIKSDLSYRKTRRNFRSAMKDKR